MGEGALAQAVEQFAQMMQGASEADLNRPWAWGAYDSEGVRFAMFRTFEELRTLAVQVAAERAASGQAPSQAQRILAQYHAAYRDLEAALLGLSDADIDRAPAEGEWSVHKAIMHMADADAGFYVGVRYALERHRSGDGRPAKIPNEAWDTLLDTDEAAFTAIMNGPFAGLRRFHQTMHERVLYEFADVRDDELELPSMYWEPEPMPLRFRLHRFESHLRQHTIQIDKTLVAIGQAPSEVKRLLRLIYMALAEIEGATLGAPGAGHTLYEATAQSIAARSDEIKSILHKQAS